MRQFESACNMLTLVVLSLSTANESHSAWLYKLNFKFQIFCNSQLATQQQQPQVNFVVITFGWKIDWKTFRCWKIPIKLTFCHRNGICRCKCSNTERLAKTSGLANYGIQPFVLWLARQQHFIGSIYEFTLQNTGSLRWTLDKSDTNWWPNNCIWKMFL